VSDPIKNTRKRIVIVLGMILLLPLAIGVQILRIQLVEGNSLRSLWDTQAIDVIPVPAQRGRILDINGRILVSNTVSYSVAIDPLAPNTKSEHISEIISTLAKNTSKPTAFYRKRIQDAPNNSRYIVLERSVNRTTYNALKSLGYKNVILEEQYRRRYNYDQLASHVIGFVNHETRGMMGLESSYNEMLRGRDGEQQVQRDRLGRIRAMVGAPRRQPIEGYTLKTTIDSHIQSIVEEELKHGVVQSRAQYGTVIVMDPRTGAIKALANYPTFDPNSPGSGTDLNRRNYAVSDMIEPGSTFKLVTAIAVVEQKAVKMNEIFDTPASGVKMIYGQAMRDHDPLGSLDFHNVIKKSSNIATSEAAMRLSKETFYQYARNLGFGSTTGIDLPNEEAGRMQKPYNWSNVTLPWMSIGYEVQVTPLQMVMAYGAFANKGVLMRPYIVDEVLDENGNTIKKTSPTRIRRAIKPETIQQLMPAFEGVVTEDGTAEFARIEGIAIGGKTGTAQKYIDGRYRTRYRASFIGFYPTTEPQYVVLVLIDEPRTSIYGGYISGPIFRRITSRIMGLDDNLQQNIVEQVERAELAYVPQIIGLNKDTGINLLKIFGFKYDIEGNGNLIVSQEPSSGKQVSSKDRIKITLGNLTALNEDQNRPALNQVPDLNGLSMRQALMKITDAGFNAQIIGSGTVFNQFPRAGEQLRTGSDVTIRGRARSMNEISTLTAGLR
jgi:cell division protein FtsI/penicillin-binding protein 2